MLMSDFPTPEPASVAVCTCCRFENPVGGTTTYRQDDGNHKNLCELCAGSYAGMMKEYARNYDRSFLHIIETVCYVGNQIRRDMQRV